MRINPRFFFTLKPLSIIIKTGSDNMFDEIKEKIRINREVKENIKRINPDIDTFTNYEIWKFFKSEGFQNLPSNYRNKFYHLIINLTNEKSNYNNYKFTNMMRNICEISYDKRFANSPNFYEYLDILLDYPEFNILRTSLVDEPDKNTKEDVLNLRREAKLLTLGGDLEYYQKELENIMQNEKVKQLGLTKEILEGIINYHSEDAKLDEDLEYKTDLIIDIRRLLDNDLTHIILKLFTCPTIKHIEAIDYVCSFPEVINNPNFLELIDTIIASPIEELSSINVNTSMEMSFKEACQNYSEEAMKILDETPNMKSYTRVRVPIHMRKF